MVLGRKEELETWRQEKPARGKETSKDHGRGTAGRGAAVQA